MTGLPEETRHHGTPRILALCGGIGGAKLALGLHHILPPEDLLVVVNTGDDFEHLGLHISPDLDTVLYTLSGTNNQELGWGRANETWTFMSAMGSLKGDTWFQLGDGDLALHVERTRRLEAGQSLSQVMDAFSQSFGVQARILPMSNDPVQTLVETTSGRLAFQHYFVREQCKPVVTGFVYDGAASASPHPDLVAALQDPATEAVIICPSNPFLSIDPILALPGLREALMASAAPVVAVSPMVNRNAVKGPLAKIMHELEIPLSSASIARHYGGLIDGFVLDQSDAAEQDDIAVTTLVTGTLMQSLADRGNLAKCVVDFAGRLKREFVAVRKND